MDRKVENFGGYQNRSPKVSGRHEGIKGSRGRGVSQNLLRTLHTTMIWSGVTHHLSSHALFGCDGFMPTTPLMCKIGRM